jgi:hypothetical protein
MNHQQLERRLRSDTHRRGLIFPRLSRWTRVGRHRCVVRRRRSDWVTMVSFMVAIGAVLKISVSTAYAATIGHLDRHGAGSQQIQEMRSDSSH